MRKIIIVLLSVMLVLSFFGCEDTGAGAGESDGENTGDGLWSDSESVISRIELEAEQSVGSRSLSKATVETNKVYFRSSDIEFWSISSEDDLNSIFSSKYNISGGYSGGESLEYILGDSQESVSFTPYTGSTVSLGNGLNPDWDTYTADFINAGKTEINLARLDIGGGGVTFIIDGQEQSVQSADGSSAGGIDANSIFFIDEQFLSKAVLVTRTAEMELQGDSLTAEDLGLSDAEFSFIRTLFRNTNTYDTDGTKIDLNGALCLPLTPVDISDFDPLSDTLTIQLTWAIADAIHLRNGEYFLDNRVGKTSFNFEVSLLY